MDTSLIIWPKRRESARFDPVRLGTKFWIPMQSIQELKSLISIPVSPDASVRLDGYVYRLMDENGAPSVQAPRPIHLLVVRRNHQPNDSSMDGTIISEQESDEGAVMPMPIDVAHEESLHGGSSVVHCVLRATSEDGLALLSDVHKKQLRRTTLLLTHPELFYD